jgi:hypothetical protein
MATAKDFGLSAVSGGVCHGCRANTALNLTRSASFVEFVAEAREDRRSEVLLLPEYRESSACNNIPAEMSSWSVIETMAFLLLAESVLGVRLKTIRTM